MAALIPITTSLGSLSSFEPMSRVRLHGLSRQELNGKIATVLVAENEAEQQQLAESGRVKVSGYPKALSLRVENLEPAPVADFRSSPVPFTVLQVARCDPEVSELCRQVKARGEETVIDAISSIDSPHDFAEALWQVYGNIGPAGALPDDFSSLILDRPGHWLYWIGLEQIDHHIVIESCDGVWRGYQACKRVQQPNPKSEKFASFGGILLESNSLRTNRGYSAREWVSTNPEMSGEMVKVRGIVEENVIQQREKVSQFEREAYDSQRLAEEARNRVTEAEIAAANAELQALEAAEKAKNAAEALADAEKWLAENSDMALSHVGTHIDAYDLWGGGRDLGRSDTQTVLELVGSLQQQAQAIAEKLREQIDANDDASVADWAERVLLLGNLSVTPSRPSTPRNDGGKAESDSVWIFADASNEPQCELNVATKIAFPFMQAFAKLTGEFPDAAVFLRILEMSGWEDLERDDGGSCGWTFRSLNLRERSEERS